MDNLILTPAQTKFLQTGTKFVGYGEHICNVKQSVLRLVLVGDKVQPIAYEKNDNIFQPMPDTKFVDIASTVTTPCYGWGKLKDYDTMISPVSGEKVYDLGGFYIKHKDVVGCKEFLLYIAHNGHLAKIVSKGQGYCVIVGIIKK